jgi:PAS domain S-box-containing protein
MKDENKIKAESIKELKTLRKKTEESALNNVTKRNQVVRREEQLVTEMDFLYKTALDFIQIDPKDDIYRFIGKKLKEIVGDSIVLINHYDKASNSFQVRALEGFRERIKKTLKIIGKDLLTMSFPVNNEEARNALISGELSRVPGGLYELTFGQIPKSICHVLEKFLNAGKMYVSGFTREKELFGNIIIIMPKGVELKNREFINIFIKQAAIVLQKKQAEEELKDSEERLKILFDYAPDAYYITDSKGKFIDGNLAAERLIGYKREELIGKNFSKLKLLSVSDMPKAAKALVKNLRGQPTGPDEFVLNRKDNNKVTVEISTYPVKIKGRTLALGIARDITEQKKAEEALQESEEKYRALYDNAPLSYQSLNKDGSFRDVNPAWLKTLGYDRKEVIGKWFGDFLHPDWKEHFEKNFPEFKRCGYLHDVQFKIRHKDGHYLDISFEGCIGYNPDGSFKQTYCVFQDITKRKKAEKALQEAHDQLEDKVAQRTEELQNANLKLKELDRLKSMFIASMSHELRTPLSFIIGFADIMLKEISGEINHEQRRQLTLVKNHANHLLGLINDAIDINKIDAGKVEMAIEEFDLSVLSREIKDSFFLTTDKKGQKLSLEIPQTLLIESDRRRIKQILINLISNAIKFTARGEIKIKVIPKETTVEVSVRDNGIGIKKENMDKLFKSFSQIPNPGRIEEGTGLGLYLSKKNANLLNGDIMAESDFGKGSVFILTLPLKYKEGSV